MLTAYDYPTARHAERAGVDVILVGDSLGMVVLGHRTTQSVTMDNIIHHTIAARNGAPNSFIVADMPFGSYETSAEEAVQNAIRLVKETGADAVKLEGGASRQQTIHKIVNSGVAVMAHVGLLPQSVSRVGSFRAAARTAPEAEAVIADAIAVEEAGAFSVVIECVPEPVAALVTSCVDIPTLGIGSGARCDGQVLVYHDMLGILSHPHHAHVAPRFSKPFADVGPMIDAGIREYCRQVRSIDFPSLRYSPYKIPEDHLRRVEKYAARMKKQQSPAGATPDDSSDTVNLY